MMPEMKLIMERWNGFLQEQFEACDEQPVDIDTFMTGVELAALEPDVQKEKIEQLKKSEKGIQNLNKALTVVGLLAAIPGLQIAGGVALGATLVGMFGNAIRGRQQNKTDKKTKELLRLLCIDAALLDTIDNNIEQIYWANSGIQQELESFIAVARANSKPDPMPDFTQHLVNWLNTGSDSPYAADAPGSDTDIVMR
tara:strand:- start:195 stop:785 length:591 start_codon:yes stop_codon:yes gene_type:complete